MNVGFQPRTAAAGCAFRSRWGDCGKRRVRLLGTRHRCHRTGHRWFAVDRPSGCALERDSATAPRGGLVLPDDHRSERCDGAGLRGPFDREILDEDTDLVALSAANVAAALSGTFVVNGVSERRQIKPSSRPKDYVRAGSFLTKRGGRLRK